MDEEQGAGLAALGLARAGGGDQDDLRGRIETGLLLRWSETSRRLLSALARARGGGGANLSPEQVRRMLGFAYGSDPRTPVGFAGRAAFFHPELLEDLGDWAKESETAALQVVFLCEMARRHPSAGEGGPAKLFGVLDGTWSRKLAGPHRLVYRVTDERVDFLIARVRMPPPEEPAAGEPLAEVPGA